MQSVNREKGEESQIEYKIIPPGRFSLDIEELLRYKELFYSYAWRDIKIKYKQTVLGLLWAIIQPLVMMSMFALFFSEFLKIPTDNISAPIFYFSGLSIWTLFTTSVSNASSSMVSNAGVIQKIYFPRLIIPMSSVLVAIFDYLMTLLVFIGLIIYYEITNDAFSFSIWKFIVFVPLSVLITSLTSFGIGTIIASYNVKYRDFRFLIGFMIQVLMFATPVIYPVSILNDYKGIKYILSINPIMTAVNMSRIPFQNIELDFLMVSISVVSMTILFFLGIYIFKKTEKYFADLA